MSVRVKPPATERRRTAPEDPPEIETIKVIDWQKVRDALMGRGTAISRTQAVAELVAANHPNAHRDLEIVLKNPAEPPRLRALAALSLARLSSRQVEEILIEATDTRDEQVLAAVMRALGRVGEEKGLRAIEAATHAKGVAARQASFAAALISHRLGLEGHDLPVPSPAQLQKLPEAAARPFRMQRLTGADAEYAVLTLSREGFRIEYDEDSIHEIRCANNRWLVVFNREVTKGDGLTRLRDRKTFAGVWASYQEENETFSARFLMLTAPEGGGKIRIHMHHLTGEPAFFGHGEVKRDSHPFSVRSVDGPGAFPILVEGRYLGEGQLEVTTARAALFIRQSNRPQQSIVKRPGRE